MLGMRKYTQKYIDGCRESVESDLAAYRKMAGAAGKGRSSRAAQVFESTFFNNMVLVLEHSFVHRLRTVEGKDGNPLNEVRLLADSMLTNNNKMKSDRSIKLSPETSVLKYREGDEIKLSENDFTQLSKAFFAEIENKYL